MTEEEFNKITESMTIPPNKHNFKTNKVSKKQKILIHGIEKISNDRNNRF